MTRARSEVDDLLADIDGVLGSGASTSARPPSGRPIPIAPRVAGRGSERSAAVAVGGGGRAGGVRCAPCPSIAGARLPLGGPSSHFDAKACDAMRCTGCDFDVLSFERAAWRDGVDYMFFRNAYPDAGKLSAATATRRGGRAYCCQCSWRSAREEDVEEIKAMSGTLRWVCGGH